MIALVAQFSLKPGKREEFMTIVRPLIKATRNEKGCIDYTLHEDMQKPDHFAFIEHWADESALEGHKNSEHVQMILPKMNELRTAPSVIFLYNPIE
jgi:quinol monooxygenase YgiN